MHLAGMIIATLFISSVLLVDEVTCQSMLSPPERPARFGSAEDLRQYLKALNEYYSIVGRPRFGRSVNKRSLANDLFQTEDLADEYPDWDDVSASYLWST